MKNKSVLISGAGIAGPVLGFWLSRYGLRPTIIERSKQLRTQGQMLDIRGSGLEVTKQMELEEHVRSRTTKEEGTNFVDSNNSIIASFPVHLTQGRGFTSDIELIRGELVNTLYESTKNNVEYIFDDYISSIQDNDENVQITFNSGIKRNFDVIVGADGQSSKVRRLTFGKEDSSFHPLGLYCCYFTVPYEPADGTYSRWFNAPKGRAIWLRPDGKQKSSRALFMISCKPNGLEKLDVASQKQEIQKIFQDAGWETTRLLKAMHESTDFYLQTVAQVKLPHYHSGRTVLIGDAAYCPSPFSGMGTSLAITGAYVLAGELATKENHKDAFESYEKIIRPYVNKVQSVSVGCPQSSVGVWFFNKTIVLVNYAMRSGIFGWFSRLAPPVLDSSKDIKLPIYK
ncbi:hypothetical protein AKO1_012414 [Acrasis kona]|uniref:FAD-binding domain-containing protein n=1 Tax=Acrasis kona TaxID=1008807 RepID=A0AAW2YY04_9EUKA